ncbi:hypothetical protein GT037_011143, partial [Alternaria burnsii]
IQHVKYRLVPPRGRFLCITLCLAVHRDVWPDQGDASQLRCLLDWCCSYNGYDLELADAVCKSSLAWLWCGCFDGYHPILHCGGRFYHCSWTVHWGS